MSSVTPNNVFSIPPGGDFLNTLARSVIDGSILHQGMVNSSDLILARTTIYLPTRRAARALRAEFASILDGKASLLPKIRTLGDSDEEEFLIEADGAETSLLTQKIAEPMWRQIQLARLVKKWVDMIGEEARQLYRDENIIIPSSSAEALWLAREVAHLIDQLTTEEISWSQLEHVVPLEHAQWWGLTLDFLKIAANAWPQELMRNNQIDIAQYRTHVLDARCVAMEHAKDPVIVAGSTGSIPATARFLKAVSNYKHGAVVLPGVDFSLNTQVWQEISGNNGPDSKPSTYGYTEMYEDHPQFGLANILSYLGVNRDCVIELGDVSPAVKPRSRLNSIALLPSKFTDQWLENASQINSEEFESATSNISVVNAPGERQEALAIALILREALEEKKTRAALVTPNRKLARRVMSELRRFGLEIDDSAGVLLDSTPEAVFIRLIINVVCDANDGVALSTLVKHPLLFGAANDSERQHLARLFELSMVRDVAAIPQVGKLAEAIEKRQEFLSAQSHINCHVAKMDESDWRELRELCARIDNGFVPLLEAMRRLEVLDIAELFAALNTSLLILSQDELTNAGLFDSLAGQQFEKIFATLDASAETQFKCRSGELPAMFDALISGEIVRVHRDFHPRIAIFGPLEARLQPIDVVVLGGLNEGSWPQTYDSGPFLNRPMKTTVGLSAPERRTGLAAHDFEQFMGYEKVFITRSERADNAPSVPSRWLQRFLAVAGEKHTAAMTERGENYLNWANLLDHNIESKGRIIRPCPTPPVSVRPQRLSITDIEKWIRDPYAIYAKRILNLAPLPNIGLRPEPILRGILLHDAFAEYISEGNVPSAADAFLDLMEYIEREVERQQIPAHLMAIWLPQFKEIAEEFIKNEIEYSADIAHKHCEIDGRLSLAAGKFELYGRADRVDVRNDGRIEIIDYKTGDRPSSKEARSLSPQLALEGAIAIAGGFKGVAPAAPECLSFMRLKAHGNFKIDPVNNKTISAEEISHQAREWLEDHIALFSDQSTGYLSRYAVSREAQMDGDYDHLARVREWSWGSGNEGADASE